MISRATLDRLLLLQHHANGGHQSDVDEFSMALLEESKDLLDAAVGYVCMREQGDALADDLVQELSEPIPCDTCKHQGGATTAWPCNACLPSGGHGRYERFCSPEVENHG